MVSFSKSEMRSSLKDWGTKGNITPLTKNTFPSTSHLPVNTLQLESRFEEFLLSLFILTNYFIIIIIIIFGENVFWFYDVLWLQPD